MTTTQTGQSPVYRPFTFGVTRAVVKALGDNTYLTCEQSLAGYPERITERLLHWARVKPDQTLFAQRDPLQAGEWRRLSFAQALDGARRIGQALLNRGLSAERPLVILSENSLDHALLALGAMYVGVPFSPVSPAYSLVSKDFDKLRHVLSTLNPGLVFAADWKRYQRPIETVVPAEVEVVLGEISGVGDGSGVGSSRAHRLASIVELLATEPTPAVDAAMQATNPDTIVKFLFTSGSTKMPKAVINTQRMICANQQQMLQSQPVLEEDPLVLVDWLPWNHTAGGNHNFFMVLYNGGSLYIDEGKPTPALLGETLRNLREIAPTWYFNVPVGYEAIVRAMETDEVLRRNFFSRLRQQLYSGAALAEPIQDALYAHAEREYGERIVMTAGLGMTESSPFALFVTSPHSKAGHVGLPAPGLEIKLARMGDKLEVRYRGPNITPGYWRNPEASAEAFDEEGFFCSGDAATWIDPANHHLGLKFDGRVAEDFKLSTGTFVSVGPLRAKIIAASAPYLQDAVITGLNLNEIGALLIPTPDLRKIANLPATLPMAEVVASPVIKDWLQTLLVQLAKESTGSATRVARALIMTELPSLDLGEVTDKGSINQRAVLKHRSALVDALHAGTAPHIALL